MLKKALGIIEAEAKNSSSYAQIKNGVNEIKSSLGIETPPIETTSPIKTTPIESGIGDKIFGVIKLLTIAAVVLGLCGIFWISFDSSKSHTST